MDAGRGFTAFSEVFDFQSYFDSTLLELAIADQGVGDKIAKGTIKSVDSGGIGVALHPTSETPVAIELLKGKKGSLPVVILKPGQILRGVQFEGLRWGLPFGWLGGGLAHLIVISDPSAEFRWPKDDAEVIFHRQRMAVFPAATNFAVIEALYADGSGPRNWPLRFPARTTRRLGVGVARIDQSGQPTIRVQPTRTVLQLRLATIAVSGVTRFMFLTPEALRTSTPAGTPTEASFYDLAWGITANVGAGGTLPAQYPVQEVSSGPLVTFGVEQPAMSGVVCYSDGVSAQINAGANNVFVDIVRYGKI